MGWRRCKGGFDANNRYGKEAPCEIVSIRWAGGVCLTLESGQAAVGQLGVFECSTALGPDVIVRVRHSGMARVAGVGFRQYKYMNLSRFPLRFESIRTIWAVTAVAVALALTGTRHPPRPV